MVKIIPDAKSVQEILKAVNEVVECRDEDRQPKIIALTPYNWIGCMHGVRACKDRDAVPLATYRWSKTRGLGVEYSEIVQNDDLLRAQFEEALRVALMNVKVPQSSVGH